MKDKTYKNIELTSRAKKSTFILVDEDYDDFVNLPNEVRNYLSRFRNEFSFKIQLDINNV